MTDSRPMFRTWWRDQVDYHWLVETLDARGALGRFKFMLGAGGIVMLVTALLAAMAQGDVDGPVYEVQGWVEAAFAGAWTLRWWLLPWPREAESIVWIALFDIDATANVLLVHDRTIGVLGVVLLMAMGGYVAVFHGPRILALHIGWSVLTSVILAVLIATGRLPGGGQGGTGRQDLALGITIVLVMVVVVAVILPFVQFCNWLLRVDALSDPLTDLMNRRGLDSYLSARIGRCPHGTMYVATIDLDRFKTVNDTFGHPFGDEVLIRTAQRLRGAVDRAILARTGGEEFVVVGYLREDAAAMGDRLRRAIETMPDLPVTITASVGVAVLDATHPDTHYSDTTYRQLLRDSDAAMYRAKRLGGNTVVVAASAEPVPAPPERRHEVATN
ncbi:sensor domain-containing diguanylate cyclase [Nocardia transvalensis]|uniref:GGDEF domain-containing protein n=1 Tax=Nocardia transvalensis TaxID=37333 RepID=UPI001895318E|nr:GGDEF domain-containing protein [Nocardia transvalensis]MBF6327749.1 GGDEF domain-containing protein [Nocardia transvalensis]